METRWGPLGEQVYARTYSRRMNNRRETWNETVSRVVQGNLELVEPHEIEPDEGQALTELFLELAALPAGRHLWVGGVPGRQYLFNCHRAGFGPRLADHFCFTFDELMKGGGVGANYSNSFLQDLPLPAGRLQVHVFDHTARSDREEFAHRLTSPSAGDAVFRIPDSRQGWVSALDKLITLSESGGGTISFDTSAIRPRGSLIMGFGGTASGPGPLIELLLGVADLLNNCVGKPLTSLDAMSIDHQIASCVVAGNVRRSARMSIKSWKDPDVLDFIRCKLDNPESHWSTNISVEIDHDFIEGLGKNYGAELVLEAVLDGMLENGEPGFYNSSLASIGERGDVRSTNPCGEIPLEDFEPCNLGHLNLAALAGDRTRAIEAARLMTRFLIRATFGDVESPRQREVLDRNRRIGVGLFGVQEWAAHHGVKWSEIPDTWSLQDWIAPLVDMIDKEAERYAHQLMIPVPIKTRTIAPTGTIAKLPGVTEGIHPIYARHFVQRIRYSNDDPLLQDEIKKGRYVEDCIYSQNTTVVSIPTRNSILDKFEENLIEQVDEIELDDLFRVQAWFQKFWADNAVSFTANINPGTKRSELEQTLRTWLRHLKGTTVFPDLSRPQSPYERIDRQTFLELTGSSQVEVGQDFDECSTGACPVR